MTEDMRGLTEQQVDALRERGWSDQEIRNIDNDLLLDTIESTISSTAKTATVKVE